MKAACKKGLNRDEIKCIAMVTMFCNHLAIALLPGDTLLYKLLVNIGYFTAVTMCYFLVEGYDYTHSRKKYGQRLLIFGFISQIPYVLATGFYQLNMMFTLFFCFLILLVLDKVKKRPIRIVCIIGLVVCTLFSDWPLFAAVYTIMFAFSRHNRFKTAISFGVAALLFAAYTVLMALQTVSWPEALLQGAVSCLGILVSGIVILFLYNKESANNRTALKKWFFYMFYPAHLLLLGILYILIY